MTEQLKRLKVSPVTNVFLAINIILWILVKLTSKADEYSPILLYGMQQNVLIANAEIWRLFTAGFLHEAWWHILANMVFLGTLGPLIEWIYDRKSYVIIVFVSIIFGNLMSFAFADSYTFSLGFSGAGCGMLGVILGFLFFYKGDEVLVPLAKQIIPGILMMTVILFFIPNVGHIAHAGGYICGFLLCGALQSDQKREIKNANYICIAILIVLAIALAIYGYRRNVGIDLNSYYSLHLPVN